MLNEDRSKALKEARVKQISSIIVSSTVQGEGLYNRNYIWEGGGGGTARQE